MTRPSTTGRTTAVGLCLTLGVGSLPIPVWDHEFSDVSHLIVNELLYWSLVAVVLLYVIKVERRPLSFGDSASRTRRPASASAWRPSQDSGCCTRSSSRCCTRARLNQ
jgi:hypothetical protein